MTLTFLIITELVRPVVAVDSRNVTDWLCWVVYCDLYFLNLAWHRLALFNSNTLTMLWWLMKGCMGQRFYNAVVWIAGRVRVKKGKKVGNYLRYEMLF